eukprot:jgi/Mesvir1/21204/Mv02858-RA.1
MRESDVLADERMMMVFKLQALEDIVTPDHISVLLPIIRMDRAQTFAGFGVEPPVINEADEYATTLLFPLIDEPSSVVRQWLLGMVCNFVPPSQFVSSFSAFLEEEFVTHASEEMTEARCPFFISNGSLILSPACRQKSDELWGSFMAPRLFVGYCQQGVLLV